MSKQDQLVEYIEQDILYYLQTETQADWMTSMKLFFTSSISDKLLDFDTGLYRESSAYIYELLKDEIQAGHIIQKEI